MLLVLHNVTMASLRTFARKVAADDETWCNNNQTWARANFSFFIYFLFQIKWHFEFFFTEKWGVDIHPIHPPCIRPWRQLSLNFQKLFDYVCSLEGHVQALATDFCDENNEELLFDPAFGNTVHHKMKQALKRTLWIENGKYLQFWFGLLRW